MRTAFPRRLGLDQIDEHEWEWGKSMHEDEDGRRNQPIENISEEKWEFQFWVDRVSGEKSIEICRREYGRFKLIERYVPCVQCGEKMISSFEVYERFEVRRHRRCRDCREYIGIFKG